MLNRALLIFVSFVILSFSFRCTVDEGQITEPVGDPDKYLIYKSFLASKEQLFSHGDSCAIQLQIVDYKDIPKPDIPVLFYAIQGTITPSDTTDTAGIAKATYISGDNTGIDKIGATTGVKKDSLALLIIDHTASIELSTDTIGILADGKSSTTITAEITDILGNPVSGTAVGFSTTLGSLDNKNVVTDGSGEGTVMLTSNADIVDQIASVKCEISSASDMKDSINIIFRGIELTVAALDNWLIADGVSSAQIIAQLQEQTSGNPLYNKTIFWATTSGTIHGSSTTNSFGQATTTLISGTEANTAIVTASFGSILNSYDSIEFRSPSDSSLIMSYVESPIDNDDGTHSLIISVLFVDELSNPVDSTVVNFSLVPNTIGTIISPQTIDINGLATTTLTYSSQFVEENVRIWATSGSTIGYLDISLPKIN